MRNSKYFVSSLLKILGTPYTQAPVLRSRRLGKFDKYGKVELEIITPHFPKGRTDIKLA